MSDRDAYEVLQVTPQAHAAVIQAAYRALAALHHPDRDASPAATRRMAELNDAYAKVRTADRRALYDRERMRRLSAPEPVVPPYRPPSAPRQPKGDTAGAGVLDFGRYAGWTIRQLARQDPDYLRWLSRHSSGIRFRAQIAAVLAEAEASTVSPPSGRRRKS